MSDIPPIFRTDTQRRLLAELLFDDGEPRTLTDLADAIGVEQTTVMREANRLLDAGLLTETRIGRARTVEIDEDSPFVGPLRQLFGAARRSPDGSSEQRAARRRHPSRTERARHERRPLPSARTRP